MFIRYTHVICDPRAQTLTIKVRRAFLGWVFQLCLPRLHDGHFNLQDVLRFTAGIRRTGKGARTHKFVVTTAEGESAFGVNMSVESGDCVVEWMENYLAWRRLRTERMLVQTQQRERHNTRMQREHSQTHTDTDETETENNQRERENIQIPVDNNHTQRDNNQRNTQNTQQSAELDYAEAEPPPAYHF